MKRLWRVAGALCIAYVVLLLAGYSQQRSPAFGASAASIASLYSGVPAGKMYAGAVLVTTASLLLLTAFTLVSRLMRGETEGAGWASALILTAGTAAAAVTLVGSYAGAFAAYYAATHGFGADTVAGLNMISKFSDLIAAAATGVCALAIGGAGLASRRLPRWAAWISIVVGAVDIVSGTGPAQLNVGTLVGFVWMVMLGVVLLRGPSRVSLAPADDSQTASRVAAGLS
jgi:hypothetical protein